ncbi:MAG: hypothetical protein SFV23_26295 [Planctomycetaceae bacterium]|nr:hypothetical protein [Planctomycetaceae bacterium]
MNCPSCSASVAVNLAQCPYCGRHLERSHPPSRSDGQLVPQPDRFQVADRPHAYTIQWRQDEPLGLGLAAVAFFVGISVVGLLLHETLSPMPYFQRTASLIVVVGFGVVLVCALLAGAVKYAFNVTTIGIRHGELRVDVAPWFQRTLVRLPAADVKQVYCREVIAEVPTTESAAKSCSVELLLHNGRTVRLVGGLLDALDARFLEQQLETRLRLRDLPVAGERSQT